MGGGGGWKGGVDATLSGISSVALLSDVTPYTICYV